MHVRFVTSPYLDYGSWLFERVEPRMTSYISIGILSLVSHLRDNGHSADVFDLNNYINDQRSPDSSISNLYHTVAAQICDGEPAVVGFMTEYYSYHHLLNIANAIKQHSPSTIVVFGGPQASATDVSTIERFPQVDFIVRGESELTLVELANAIASGAPCVNVKGITFSYEGRPTRTLARPLISDLDELKMPAFDLATIGPSDLISIEAGRGGLPDILYQP